MSRDKARQRIDRCLHLIDAAYWAACDAEGRAIDPEELGAPDSLLDESYEAALLVEGIAESRGISWAEARDFV